MSQELNGDFDGDNHRKKSIFGVVNFISHSRSSVSLLLSRIALAGFCIVIDAIKYFYKNISPSNDHLIRSVDRGSQ